jgi:Purine catabolism regulatory protein-like family/PucR C-terminal helix-turn-helix domain/GGDEF-like domain
MKEAWMNHPDMGPTTTVATLVERLPGLAVRAGAHALNRELRWVHVSELPDPTPYLRGAELVLSAGVYFPSDPAEFRAYAQRLGAFGVAGLGIGISPIHQTVPPALVDACAELALPLLEVPPSIPFIAISEAVVSELEAQRQTDLGRLNQAQRSLVRAATRPRAMPAIVRQLAEHLQAGVILAEPGQPAHLTAGGPLPSGEAIAAIVSQMAGEARSTSAVVHDGSTYLLVQPVHGGRRRAALVIARTTPLSPPERGIVSVALSVLALVRHGAASEPGLLFASALARVTAGASVAECERPVAQAFGVRPGSRWRAVACAAPATARSRESRDRWHAGLRAMIASPLVADEHDATVAVLPDRPRPDTLVRELARAGNLVGMSDPRPWADIGAAVAEARSALAAARITGISTPGEKVAPALWDVVDASRGEHFSASLLGPVHQARPNTAPILLMTLRTWLENHGSWDGTASALGVHRNTVRNRIALVQQLLGRDLNDADVRMQLWFALRWHNR